MELFRISDDLIAEHDANLSIVGLAAHRFEAGLFRGPRFTAIDVSLELAHEEQQGHDRERPHGQDPDEQQLVIREFGHPAQCGRA